MVKRAAQRPASLSNGANQDALIELSDVVKTFSNAAGEFTALRGINVGFRPGEFVSVVGRSGSGKSTLLNMMTGIDHPTSGTVRVGATVLHKLDEGRLSVWRGRNMGIVFQFFQLLPMLTLLENVILPMDFCKVYAPAEREPRARRLLEMVGLQGLENKYPAAVSGGQQQTAAVARALATDPPILVADEPTGNLDGKTAEVVLEILEDQARQGKTIIMVTHDISLARRAERILIISDGALIPEGVSRAFPELPHDLMLALARGGKARAYQTGEELRPGNGLLIISRGSVDGIAKGRWNTRVLAERLKQGGFISREDETSLGLRLAGFIAAGPVEALWIERIADMAEIKPALAAEARRKAAVFAQAAKQRGERRADGE